MQTKNERRIKMDVWKMILAPFATLGIEVLVYDQKIIKNAYRKWLKVHHPDKKKNTDEDEIFLKIYSKFLKDLEDNADDMWQTILEIEEAVRLIEKARTEDEFRQIRRKIQPNLDFNIVTEEMYPAGYVRALEVCLRYVKSEMLLAATTFCTKHSEMRGQGLLVSECKRCMEDEGVLTKCLKHSTLFKNVYKEECDKCEREPVHYVDSGEELPDLDLSIPSEDADEADRKNDLESDEAEEKSHIESDEDIPDEVFPHPSIIKVGDNIPNLLWPIKDSENYRCVLCTETDVIKKNQQKRHTSIHKNYIETEHFRILLCKRSCRNKCHYHCPFCGITHMRRKDAQVHYIKCETGNTRKKLKKKNKFKKESKQKTKEPSKKATQYPDSEGPSTKSGREDSKDPNEPPQSGSKKLSEDTLSNEGNKFPQNDMEEQSHTDNDDSIKTTKSTNSSSDEKDFKIHSKSHESIVGRDDNMNVCLFSSLEKGYTCKLCPSGTFIPENKVAHHSNLHVSHFICVEDKKALLCKQKCRNSPHYHCPFCNRTYVRKIDGEHHANKCRLLKKNRKKKSEKVIDTPLLSQKFTSSGLPAAKRKRKKVSCKHCKKEMFPWNLMQHVRNVHSLKTEYITQSNYLESVCTDRQREIYLVHSGSAGPNIPLFVQRKIVYGQTSQIFCESKKCTEFNRTSRRSNKPDIECRHVESVKYNAVDGIKIHLQECEMLNTILRPQTIADIKKQRKKAAEKRIPHVVAAEFTGDKRRIHFSVFEENSKNYYSRLNSVRVTYDKHTNLWTCACCEVRSCMHKYTAKWACLVQYPEVFSDKKVDDLYVKEDEEDFEDGGADNLTDELVKEVENILNYQMTHKKIPAKLPETAINKSRMQDFPVELHPTEQICISCSGELQEILVTETAVIVTKTGSIRNIKTFQKNCDNCNLRYNYQEFEEGLHNYNNHLILSLELCLHLRSMLCSHTAVSRVVHSIEIEYETNLPYRRDIFDGYLHFENLCNHNYEFSCNICGKHPVKLIGDGHKKTCFNLNVEDLPLPPDSFDGNVDCKIFWNDISKDLLSRAYIKGASTLQVKPSLSHWAGWIGEEVRNGDVILNTEFLKVKAEKEANSKGCIDEVTDEHLQDLLYCKAESDVKKLCKEMKLSTEGSKCDLIMRIKRQARVPDLYKKIMTKIKGHCGGWVALACEHGCTYGIKFVIRAESVRDYSDMLLSMQQFPNIVCCDLAPRLAHHTNLRCPERLPFHPFEGAFLEQNEENVALLKIGKLSTSLPWLEEKQMVQEEGAHPVTGSNHHYCCLDRLHEKNWKDDMHKLRSVKLVQELAGSFNTQACEQLNGDMSKNNYFLNMMTPSAQLFIFRFLLHLRNLQMNKKHYDNFQKEFPGEPQFLDRFGRLVYGKEQVGEFEDVNPSVYSGSTTLTVELSDYVHSSGESIEFDVLDQDDFLNVNVATPESEHHSENRDENVCEQKDERKPERGNKETMEAKNSRSQKESAHEREREKDKEKRKREEKSPQLERKKQNDDTVRGARKKTKIDVTQKKTRNQKAIFEQSAERQFQKYLAELPWHQMPKTHPINLPAISRQFTDRISNFTSLVDSTEMLQFNSYVVKRSNMATLKCDEWLDDQVVNAYMNLLASEYNMLNTVRRALHLDSFLMSGLIIGRSHTLLKSTFFRDYRYIMIPVHHHNHWCLMIVYVEDEEISYIDPLNPGIITDQGLEFIRKFKAFSVNRLTSNPLDIHLKDFRLAVNNHNKQQDGASCGVWVLMFAEQVLGGNITPKQSHVSYFRWYVAYKLYNSGKRSSEHDRSICDVRCKIGECGSETVKWIQCDSYMCANWVHPFCMDLPQNYEGEFICPTCSIKKA